MADIFQQPKEIEVLVNQVKIASRIEGDFAEVGVYMGRSAEIIKQQAPDKTLYLFDTFTGLPDQVLPEDQKHYLEVGDMGVSLLEVKDYSGVKRAMDEFLKDKEVNKVQSGSRQLILTV